jgi:hypothetical protein
MLRRSVGPPAARRVRDYPRCALRVFTDLRPPDPVRVTARRAPSPERIAELADSPPLLDRERPAPRLATGGEQAIARRVEVVHREVDDRARAARVLHLARGGRLVVGWMEEELGEVEVDERAAVHEPERRFERLAPERRRRGRVVDEEHDLGDPPDACGHALGAAPPDDSEAPRLPCSEEPVRVDVGDPADQMPLRLALRRPVDGEPHLRIVLRGEPARELLAPALGLLRGGTFGVALGHDRSLGQIRERPAYQLAITRQGPPEPSSQGIRPT